jgi:alpha/beta superfamily hydrolase
MASAVLLHPHPDMGGNQHNNVISALYERLPSIGITPHRFDFASSDLEQARAQAVAAIEAAGEPVYLIGYSFGGGVAATIDHPGVLAWGLIAPALTLFEPVIGPDPRPKHVIAGERDAWFDPEMLTAATATWAATTIAVVAGADHFFGGGGDTRAAELITGWIAPLLAAE